MPTSGTLSHIDIIHRCETFEEAEDYILAHPLTIDNSQHHIALKIEKIYVP